MGRRGTAWGGCEGRRLRRGAAGVAGLFEKEGVVECFEKVVHVDGEDRSGDGDGDGGGGGGGGSNLIRVDVHS